MIQTLTIHLDGNRGTACHCCGAECSLRYGLPVDNTGAYVANDYAGEWGGVPACVRCYELHRTMGPEAVEAVKRHGYRGVA